MRPPLALVYCYASIPSWAYLYILPQQTSIQHTALTLLLKTCNKGYLVPCKSTSIILLKAPNKSKNIILSGNYNHIVIHLHLLLLNLLDSDRKVHICFWLGQFKHHVLSFGYSLV
jgi:hypothetical protein